MIRVFRLFLAIILFSAASSFSANAATIEISVKTSSGSPFIGAPVKVHNGTTGVDTFYAADGAGKVVISNASTATYLIQPLVNQVTFTPASKSVAVSNTSVFVEFSGNIGTGAITGKVIEGTTNQGAADANIFIPNTGWASSRANGAFGIGNVGVGAVTIIPLRACETYSPALSTVSNPGGVVVSGANFSRTAHSGAPVYGRITRNGAALAGINVEIKDLNGNTVGNGLTDANGYYAVQGLADGIFDIKAESSSFKFAPASRRITISSCQIHANQNFLAGHIDDKYKISGVITLDGIPLSGVEVIGGESNGSGGYNPTHGTVVTGTNGAFQFNDYKFTESAYVFPKATGIRFTPPRLEKVIIGDEVVNFVGHRTQCNDGIDNDGDGAADYPGDYGCLSIDSDSESLRQSACENGIDDDRDGSIDLADQGCSTNQDNSERDINGPTCDNGKDDDNDAKSDFPEDPGCSSPSDEVETSPFLGCDNGVDDDGDGSIDLADPGCNDPSDPDEHSGVHCDNGIDDDKDGFIDSRDPGCDSLGDLSESRSDGPICDNGKDDDGDGKVDLDDKGCLDVFDTTENEDLSCTSYYSADLQNTLSEGSTRLLSYGIDSAKKLKKLSRKPQHKKEKRSLLNGFRKISRALETAHQGNIALIYSIPGLSLSCVECTKVAFNNVELKKQFSRNTDKMFAAVVKGIKKSYALQGFDTKKRRVLTTLKVYRVAKRERKELHRLVAAMPDSVEICGK